MKIGIRIIGWITKAVTYFVLLASGKRDGEGRRIKCRYNKELGNLKAKGWVGGKPAPEV